MIRLFVALDLPADLRERMGWLSTGVQGARWVAPDAIHLTLRFIGEVGEEMLDDITGALRAVKGAPFPLTLGGAGHFESGRRVRALWIGVERSEALFALQGRIESALVRAGLEPERRKFSAHVTLARLRNAKAGKVSDWLAANTLFRAMPFTVDGFTLYASLLGGDGPVYRTVEAFPLDRVDVTASPVQAGSFP